MAFGTTGDIGLAKVAIVGSNRLDLPDRGGNSIQRRCQFFLVVGVVGQRVTDNEQTVLRDRDLRVVMLVNAFIGAVFHNA